MANLLNYTDALITLQAGGPGSGRKPQWSDKLRSVSKEHLDKMHKSLTDKGFKYKSSHQSGTNKNDTIHQYKAPSGGKNGGGHASITENKNDNHKGVYDSGLSNFPSKLD